MITPRTISRPKTYKNVSTKGLRDARVLEHMPAMRSLWQVHVQSCLRRELENIITIDDYAEVSRQPCTYCGSPPTNETKFRTAIRLNYNGVDRRDNSLGYTPENITACCKTCNVMKSGLSVQDFLIQISRISHHQSLTRGPDQPIVRDDTAG